MSAYGDIAKLDRLSRNVAFLANLMDSGVEFVAVDNPQATRFTLHILAAVAEHEAAMISSRTKAALAAAKARGVTLGGFKGSVVDHKLGNAANQEASARFAERVGPMVTELRQSGLSLRQIVAKLNEQGIQTPRGGAWTATAVTRVMERV